MIDEPRDLAEVATKLLELTDAMTEPAAYRLFGLKAKDVARLCIAYLEWVRTFNHHHKERP